MSDFTKKKKFKKNENKIQEQTIYLMKENKGEFTGVILLKDFFIRLNIDPRIILINLLCEFRENL